MTARLAALALALFLPACGDDGPTEPEEPTRTRIGSGTFSVEGTVVAMENGFNADVATGPFATAGLGTVEILADWTSPANNIDIFLYLGTCRAEQARANSCPVANRTVDATRKPERLNVIGVPAGNYSVGFVNFGPTAETGTFEVFLTR